MQVLHITEGEEPPEAHDARVRLCQYEANETPLTATVVDRSPPKGTFRTLGETLLDDT